MNRNKFTGVMFLMIPVVVILIDILYTYGSEELINLVVSAYFYMLGLYLVITGILLIKGRIIFFKD